MFGALVWNLLLTSALAILLVAAGRVRFLSRRPALRHALWLLLLVKLVTPPLISVPLLSPTERVPVGEHPDRSSRVNCARRRSTKG